MWWKNKKNKKSRQPIEPETPIEARSSSSVPTEDRPHSVNSLTNFSSNSSTSSAASLKSHIKSSLPENPIIYDMSDIRHALFSRRHGSSSSSFRRSLCGKDVVIFQRKYGLPLPISDSDLHQRLIKLLGASLSGYYVYLVYEYVPGANLADCLRNPNNPYSDDDHNPNLSMIQTSIPISTSTLAPTQAQIPIRIPTLPISYASSAAQIMTSRLTTPTHGLDCAYCGDPRHTRETCFKLHGYPDWWATLKDRGQCNTTSNGTGYGFHTSDKIDSRSWIIDSGATDHMTFDPDDFLNTTQPRRTCIANANGVTYPVTGAGTVSLSSSLTLSNTLLVPSLSTKLLSVSQLTEQLNCCVLIYPSFCLLQDIHTKEILGRGTKRGGLYYVDDFSPGMANSVTHPFDSKQKQIWLWHRRLGHPSFSYMKHLIPDLFSGFKDSDFTCDTCILAKSHRVPYPLSTNKCTTPFTLIHSDVWGPSPITAPSGVRWFVTFIDDCTRMT